MMTILMVFFLIMKVILKSDLLYIHVGIIMYCVYVQDLIVCVNTEGVCHMFDLHQRSDVPSVSCYLYTYTGIAVISYTDIYMQ